MRLRGPVAELAEDNTGGRRQVTIIGASERISGSMIKLGSTGPALSERVDGNGNGNGYINGDSVCQWARDRLTAWGFGRSWVSDG